MARYSVTLFRITDNLMKNDIPPMSPTNEICFRIYFLRHHLSCLILKQEGCGENAVVPLALLISLRGTGSFYSRGFPVGLHLWIRQDWAPLIPSSTSLAMKRDNCIFSSIFFSFTFGVLFCKLCYVDFLFMDMKLGLTGAYWSSSTCLFF